MLIKREHLLSTVTVVLRMPTLFVLEVWFSTDPEKADVYLGQGTIMSIVYYLALAVTVAVGLLPLRKLVTFYLNLISGILVAISWFLYSSFLEMGHAFTLDEEGKIKVHVLALYIGLQCVIAATVSYLMEIRDWRRYVLLFFLFPVIGQVLEVADIAVSIISSFVHFFVSLLLAQYLITSISVIYKTIKDNVRIATVLIHAIGGIRWSLFLFKRVLLPVQLFLFWVMLFLFRFSSYWSSANASPLSVSQEGWTILILASVGDCCGTPVSLAALCVTIAYISYFVLSLTKLYLQGWAGVATEEDMMRGWTEGLTMLLIAMQTGLLDLKPLERAFLMSVLLFIVTASLIQSMHEVSDPVLLSLSASHNQNVFKHVRVLLLFTFLWMFPLYMTYSICQYFDLDMWLLVIMSSCILTSVQVIGSLVVYTLFMYDSCSSEPWESLDDVIYYTRAIVRTLEFIVALFVVWYGLKESLFGTWSWINCSILIVHCYFNVWKRFQSGWNSFLLRREAVKRLESLPTATSEQLGEYNDVCPICYQLMSSAKITSCGHYFHPSCLKKWLYIKDTCPMCHKKIDQTLVEDTAEEVVTPNPNQPGHNNAVHSNDDTAAGEYQTENQSDMAESSASPAVAAEEEAVPNISQPKKHNGDPSSIKCSSVEEYQTENNSDVTESSSSSNVADSERNSSTLDQNIQS